jgi:hypothetical protein
MSGLREEVIAIICEEWQKGQDRETEVNATTISERLQKDGGGATEAQVKQEIIHLSDQGAIRLAVDRPDTPAIVRVNPDLCL